MTRFSLVLVTALASTSIGASAQSSIAPDTTVRAPSATTVAVQVAPIAAPLAAAATPLAGAPLVAPALLRKTSPVGGPTPVPSPANERKGLKYMIIGAGVLLTGAIIDDDAGDILMVGGVFFGLYGLWVFLN